MIQYNDPAAVPADAFKNLLTEANRCTLEEVQHNARLTLMDETRLAQDERMLYYCLKESITKEASDRVSLHDDAYTIRVNNHEVLSGTVLLKIIITLSRVDNQANARMLRLKLSKLTMEIQDAGYDIIKFNEKVKRLEYDLNSYGHKSENLISSLFEAYATVPDERFSGAARIGRRSDCALVTH